MPVGRTTLVGMSVGYFACWMISKSASDTEPGCVDGQMGQMEGSGRLQQQCVTYYQCSTVAVICG